MLLSAASWRRYLLDLEPPSNASKPAAGQSVHPLHLTRRLDICNQQLRKRKRERLVLTWTGRGVDARVGRVTHPIVSRTRPVARNISCRSSVAMRVS